MRSVSNRRTAWWILTSVLVITLTYFLQVTSGVTKWLLLVSGTVSVFCSFVVALAAQTEAQSA